VGLSGRRLKTPAPRLRKNRFECSATPAQGGSPQGEPQRCGPLLGGPALDGQPNRGETRRGKPQRPKIREGVRFSVSRAGLRSRGFALRACPGNSNCVFPATELRAARNGRIQPYGTEVIHPTRTLVVVKDNATGEISDLRKKSIVLDERQIYLY